jgi:hypothetical protein
LKYASWIIIHKWIILIYSVDMNGAYSGLGAWLVWKSFRSSCSCTRPRRPWPHCQ